MEKLIKDFIILNQIYQVMKSNIDTLKTMFPTGSNIHQKLVLTERLLGQIYLCIRDKIEEEENIKEFYSIIKTIKEEKMGEFDKYSIQYDKNADMFSLQDLLNFEIIVLHREQLEELLKFYLAMTGHKII